MRKLLMVTTVGVLSLTYLSSFAFNNYKMARLGAAGLSSRYGQIERGSFCGRAELPTLETDRLILRKLELDDARDVYSFASDSEVTKRTCMITHHTSIEDTRKYIESVQNTYKKGDVAPWAVVHKRTGQVIGLISFFGHMRGHARAELGGVGSQEFWNNGLGTEAARAAIDYGFYELGLNRIYATVDPANRAAEKLLQKIGMEYEGFLNYHVMVRGIPCHRKLYAIIHPDLRK